MVTMKNRCGLGRFRFADGFGRGCSGGTVGEAIASGRRTGATEIVGSMRTREDRGRRVSESARQQLEKMLASRLFIVRPRMAGLLRFFVEESLRNGGEAISQGLIASHALALPGDFQPTRSGYVRTHVTRLRQALEDYYSTVGRDDPIVFSITPGPYRLVVTERLPHSGAKDLAERPLRTTPADRRLWPTLLVLEADDDLCLDSRREIGGSVALTLTSDLVFSPFVRTSGPLLRSRLDELGLSGQAVALQHDYHYLCEIVLSDAGETGIACTVVVTDVRRGERIVDESVTVREEHETPLRKALAAWLYHRVSEAFMRLGGDAGLHASTDAANRQTESHDEA